MRLEIGEVGSRKTEVGKKVNYEEDRPLINLVSFSSCYNLARACSKQSLNYKKQQREGKRPFCLAIKSITITGLGLCGKFNCLENHKLIRSLDFLFLLYQDKRKANINNHKSRKTFFCKKLVFRGCS